ncbi:MAG: DUF6691 family protein [Geminicoccaceae bacterium]
MKNFTSLLAGGLFGFGLVLSDMINAQRVQGFFDLFGAWDPTLVFVIIGANIPMMMTWAWVRRHQRSVLGEELPGAASTNIDKRLIGGSVLFGAGWGLVGLCPGTVMATLLFGYKEAFLFGVAMAVGFYAFGHWRSRRAVAA